MSARVYVASGCPHCGRLLEDLARRRVRFEVVNLTEEPHRLAELAALTRERRLPVVVDHERCSVGFDGGSTPFAELGLAWPPRARR
ncbi:MAG TPA: glutaredoxin family protein [Thermoanaerobaculaceae bacterium]|nr:glutaredoxin family protein [Thermoanaerobaculaceae bacterium]